MTMARRLCMWASRWGQLEVVPALVAAGADPAALTGSGSTPLMRASYNGHTDTVAFLLQLPAVKATIDHIDTDIDHVSLSQMQGIALSFASLFGHQPIVQLLLDAGADPIVPAGDDSPLNQAINHGHHAVAALLRHAIDEGERARALHKARSLLGAGAASLACLQDRVEQGAALPLAEVITLERHRQHQQQLQQHLLQLRQLLVERQEEQHLLHLQQLLHRWQGEAHEKLRATAAFAVGVSGGEKDTGMCEDLYMKLQGYMLPAWADKGPAGV